jgi:prepilin peptidase CpaA
MSEIIATMADHWVYWVVAVFAVVAAYIDGKELRVPNKLTFPMIIAGWVYSSFAYGFAGDGWYYGLMWSLVGTFVGGMTLLPFYSIGGMGAGDVKMMAAIGAWVHVAIVFYSFCVGAVVGGVIAVIMIATSGEGRKHFNQFFFLINEITTVRDPEALFDIASDRKSSMRLLPYGIPMCIGTLIYMGFMGWNGELPV